MTSLDLLTSLDLDFDPIAPKIELDLCITIMYLPTKFHQVWSNSFCVILLTNRQTDRQTDKQTNKHTEVITISRFSRDNNNNDDNNNENDKYMICIAPNPLGVCSVYLYMKNKIWVLLKTGWRKERMVKNIIYVN